MSAERVSDIVDGEVTIDTNGIRFSRHYLIKGLTGAESSRMWRAATFNGVPQPGEQHESIPNIFVTQVRAAPRENDPETYDVEVLYAPPDQGGIVGAAGVEVEFIGSTSSEETVEDKDGNKLTQSYFGLDPNETPGQTAATINLTEKTHKITVDRPQWIVRFRRKEEVLPKDITAEFTGAINSGQWSGFPAYTWLCVGIDARQNSPTSFDVGYSFAYSRATWLAELRVAVNGIRPADATIGNGIELFHVYPEVDFNRLNLQF